MLSGQSVGCCRGLRSCQGSFSPSLRGVASGRHSEGFNCSNLVGVADGSRPHAANGAAISSRSSLSRRSTAVLCSWGGDSGGNGGAGRNSRRGGNGGGGRDNNHNNNSHNSGDGFGDQLRRCAGPALLGAMALAAASAALPAASRATPGSLSSYLFHSPDGSSGSGGSGGNAALLSSSAPSRGGGGLSDAVSLERASLGLSACTSGSSSPSRPRSKVLHVPCKGSTLVVPLTGHDPRGMDVPLPLRALPWQRRKIVDAPVELSEREARMLAARQNRVRDSLLVQ